MAAYSAAGAPAHPSVTVLEKMPRPGRKIMITGKGRCNFTNVKEWNEFSRHVHPKADVLKPSFYNLPPEKLISIFEAHGLETVVERGERAFPADHNAASVVDCLNAMAREAGAELVCNCEVRDIIRSNRDGFLFTVNCSDGSSYCSRRLIITTGGLSYPRTGSSGDGYRWAERFGHSITPLFPSLCALTPKNYRYENWISLKNVSLKSIIDGNVAQECFGDLDFTDGGIEGPLGFKVSRKCVKALNNGSKVRLSIDLKPAVEKPALDERIYRLWDEISKDPRSKGKSREFMFKVLLGKVLPQDAVKAFRSSFSNLNVRNLAAALKEWNFEITSYVGYERCVITAGGIQSGEFNPKTLESKKERGLHFAGEILDLDADTGGYNLHIAFSTGCLAGLSAAVLKSV